MSESSWSEKATNSVMSRPSKYLDRWCYEFGLILKALEAVWSITGNKKYYSYIKDSVDKFVDAEGRILGYDMGEMNLDHVNAGKALLLLYRETSEERYAKAAARLRRQLELQPRNRRGGFWHKRIYPHQMWLDGVYMSSPFYAEYAGIFNEPEAFDDVLNQVVLLAEHACDPGTGLMYHAWDESGGMKWADDATGCSPHFWGRAMGWYAMALVDILDYFPQKHPGRNKIADILRSLADTVISVQDGAAGVWYQVLDLGDREGNYPEASASCMFVYALLKGIRQGYIGGEAAPAAHKGYEGILRRFAEVDARGLVNINSICSVAGLGGNPYRDGSFSYYVSEPVAVNDYKGVGPFILASVEMERAGVKLS